MLPRAVRIDQAGTSRWRLGRRRPRAIQQMNLSAQEERLLLRSTSIIADTKQKKRNYGPKREKKKYQRDETGKFCAARGGSFLGARLVVSRSIPQRHRGRGPGFKRSSRDGTASISLATNQIRKGRRREPSDCEICRENDQNKTKNPIAGCPPLR